MRPRETDRKRGDERYQQENVSRYARSELAYNRGGPGGLTAREQDVLALLARGLPNKGIARHLAISPKTVSNHIERIYTKLGVTNRAAAAMRAMEYHIVG